MGAYSVTPYQFLIISRRISCQPSEGLSHFGGYLSDGGGGNDCRSSQERQNNFLMISSEPIFFLQLPDPNGNVSADLFFRENRKIITSSHSKDENGIYYFEAVMLHAGIIVFTVVLC